MFHTCLKSITDYPQKGALGLKLWIHFPSISIRDLYPIFLKVSSKRDGLYKYIQNVLFKAQHLKAVIASQKC